MKFIKFTETRKGFTATQLLCATQLVRIYTEPRIMFGEEFPYVVFILAGQPAIACRLKTAETPIMGIITEFLEGEATILEITEYLATEEE